MTQEEIQSRTIGLLRFPLIAGVVLIHTRIAPFAAAGGEFPVYTVVHELFSDILAQVAVPLFFFFSGYLFFRKTEDFTLNTYGQKLKKRVHSLLIPYLFWNMAVAVLFLAAGMISPGLMPGLAGPGADFGMTDLPRLFWNIRTDGFAAYPASYQLWFLRDLMVVMLFTPLIYRAVRMLSGFPVLLLGILWFFDWWPHITGFGNAAFFFFTAGAWFGIRRRSFVEMAAPLLPLAAALYPLLVAAELCIPASSAYIHQAGILTGMVLTVTLTARHISKQRWHEHPFLSESSFFIYLYHTIPLVFLTKTLKRLLHAQSDLLVTLLYFICPAAVILLGLLLYYMLKKHLPAFTSVITGGR